MSRYDNRIKGSMAHVLDLAGLAEHAREYLQVVHGWTPAPDAYLKIEPIVLVKTNENGVWGKPKFATICTEGVGWMEDEDTGLVKVPLNVQEWQIGGIEMLIHPNVIARFITGEQVDLADWVRVFGERLEINLSIWQSATRAVEQNFNDYLTTV